MALGREQQTAADAVGRASQELAQVHAQNTNIRAALETERDRANRLDSSLAHAHTSAEAAAATYHTALSRYERRAAESLQRDDRAAAEIARLREELARAHAELAAARARAGEQ